MDKANAKKDDQIRVTRVDKMGPFKIEIFSEDYLNIMAEVGWNRTTRFNKLDEVLEEIKHPIEVRIDSELYKELLTYGEKSDVDIVCKYIAASRLTSPSENSGYVGMVQKMRDALKELSVAERYVLEYKEYVKIFSLPTAAYLSSICNLSGVSAEVAKMDKSLGKVVSEIMKVVVDRTQDEENDLQEAYSAVVGLVGRILLAYKERNIIDLNSIKKTMAEMFDGSYRDYYEKLIDRMGSDINDGFKKFNDQVKEVKASLDKTVSEDKTVDPMEVEPVPQEDINAAMSVEVETGLSEDDSIVGTNFTQPEETNTGTEMNTANAPENNAAAVVTGLEAAYENKFTDMDEMNEGLFKKKLRRISREVIGYIKVRGLNARDADELTMIISYGYSIAERCEWYMDIIERNDNRYVVPQTYAELDNIRQMIYKTLDELMKDPLFRQKGSIFQSRSGIGIY